MATHRSIRRVRIVDGLATLALYDMKEAARGFAAAATDIDAMRDTRHPLGTCISLINAVQAATFAGLIEAATEDLRKTVAA